MTDARRPRIALLAAPESSASVLYGLYDILSTVGPMWPDMTAAQPGDALLDVVIVGTTAEPFRCFGGILVEPHAALDDAGDVDAIVVCDMYTPIDTAPRGRFTVESAWVRQMHNRGALVATVCTGSFLLAEAGLLDGRSCAGHWAYADLFDSAYPRIRFLPGAILDLSSEPSGLITAGGVTSWQDLALHLIARYCGPEDATRTAMVYLLGGHEDGQLPFSAMSRLVRVEDAVIRDCLAWIDDHYGSPSPVSAMVERSGLTPRTFARRFRAATGRRPIDYVHGVRVEEARRLLEAGPGTVDDVGFEVGYEDPTFFRRLFKRTTGLTPAAYRRKHAQIAGTATIAGGAGVPPFGLARG
jgi:transcriptional regulator GlxA family with amidase domain